MEKAARNGLLKYGEHLADLSVLDETKVTISCDFPILKAVDVKPKEFIAEEAGIKLVRSGGDTKGVALHFFAPDYRLDAVWNKLWMGMVSRYCPIDYWDEIKKVKGKKATAEYQERKWNKFNDYLNELKHFDTICSPDHSVYVNWCHPNNLNDVWRNRIVGKVLSNEGFTVIPTISWAGTRTYEYAFLGVEPGGTYATSCIGCNHHSIGRREESLADYRDGIKEMVKRLSPKRIIVYGSKALPDADYGKAEVMFFKNKDSERGNEAMKRRYHDGSLGRRR